MKENEKRVSVLVEEGDHTKMSPLLDDKKSSKERLKKPVIFLLMGIVFMGCMYLLFMPSSEERVSEKRGLNDAVPQASEAEMQADKLKAYEQEMLEKKEDANRNDLTTLSDYWNEESEVDNKHNTPAHEEEQSASYVNGTKSPANTTLAGYRNSQSALGSFYRDDTSETQELRKQLDELKEKLADKEIPKSVTVDDQLALMEKSYQMAAKYLPTGTTTSESATHKGISAVASTTKDHFVAFTPARKEVVSYLQRVPTDSAFLANWSIQKKRNFTTAKPVTQMAQPKNSVKACIEETQTISTESRVRLRLLEPAQTSYGTIAQGTLVTAMATFQGNHLQLKVTSIALDGNIIPVDLTIYDLDGQQGLNVPYAAEASALSEIAGNMSQTSGTSLMLTQSAKQQVAADLSRGLVQGISGFFSKKLKTPKVTLKAGYQVVLVSKK